MDNYGITMKGAFTLNSGLEDGTYSGVADPGTAGETLAFGNMCYKKPADSRWWLAKADVTATSGICDVGFCVLAGNASDPILILTGEGNIRANSVFDTFTVGKPIFISAADSGKVTDTAPSGTTGYVVRCVGRAETADSIRVKISPDYLELR